jgi:hydroxypyruvate isomerase
MHRRSFLSRAAAGAAVVTAVQHVASAKGPRPNLQKFRLHYAPHFGMFEQHAGAGLGDQLRFAHDQGFVAWEDNGMKGRSRDEQTEIARVMEQLGMRMGVFVAHGSFGRTTFAGRDQAAREQCLQDIRESVEVAKRVHATWMTVVPGNYDPGTEWGFQTAACIDLLRACAEVLEPHGLVMVLEPLNWWRDHPGLFLHKIPQAYEICRAVNSPSCKILFDIYHQQISEGNLIPNIDRAWDEIAYFQCGDNPGRNEPGTGEINYSRVFQHIHRKGFTGIVGMEHGNSRPGKEGELRVVAAYREVDAFEVPDEPS